MSDKTDVKRVDLIVGESEYFLEPSSSGFVFGLRNWPDSADRHITTVVDPETEEISNVHMKSGGKQDWSIHPDRMSQDFAAWFQELSEPLGYAHVRGLDDDSYSISAHRVIIIFNVVSSLASPIARLLATALGFVRIETRESHRETLVLVRVDLNRLSYYVMRLSPFKPIVEKVLRGMIPTMVPKIARLVMKKPSRLSDGDFCLVIPKSGSKPLGIVKWRKTYLAIPLEKLYREATDWYSRLKVQDMLPKYDPVRPGPIRVRIKRRSAKVRP